MKDIETLIREYCERVGITRAQYDAEGTLTQETIDALNELWQSTDEDPIIPLGLSGAGKRRSQLTLDEEEHLHSNEMELEDLMDGGTHGH